MSKEASVRTLEKSATNLMAELTEISAKLREAGKAAIAPDGKIAESAEALSAQLEELHARVKSLATDSELLAKVDKNVRANPYLWIIGALGLGMLLGKSGRS